MIWGSGLLPPVGEPGVEFQAPGFCLHTWEVNQVTWISWSVSISVSVFAWILCAPQLSKKKSFKNYVLPNRITHSRVIKEFSRETSDFWCENFSNGVGDTAWTQQTCSRGPIESRPFPFKKIHVNLKENCDNLALDSALFLSVDMQINYILNYLMSCLSHSQAVR